MASLTTFDSTKESLLDLLRDVKDGKVQLPDFQRGWVWDDEHIRSLLASVSLSYPIGTVMMLQTGSTDVRLKPRLVDGVMLLNSYDPERLILDGQQRLTSLFQALFSGLPVSTMDARKKPIKRWYYIDIQKALDPTADREEAIFSISEERIIRNFRGEVERDFSSEDKEFSEEVFPLRLVFDVSALTDWQMRYVQADPEHIGKRLARWNRLVQEVIQRYQQYQAPLILLRKETPKEAVCQVFEKVNTGGVALNVFELLTATYAADDYNLREDWEKRQKRLRQQKVLATLENTDVLQAITVLATRARHMQGLSEGMDRDKAPAISCKRKDVLRLTLTEYQAYADLVTAGFEMAARFLHGQNVFSVKDLPYHTQLVPLAAIFAALGEEAEKGGVRAKIARWYWCGVFGELYGSGIETRFAKDLPQVVAWVFGGPEPDSIRDANFVPVRLLSVRTRNSAVYKGLISLLMRDGCLDLRTGEAVDVQVYFDERIDIHHLFPQDWCGKNGIDPKLCNSIINKAPLSAKTNRIIGGNAPSVYLERMQKSAGIAEQQMDVFIQSYAIESSVFRANDFTAFYDFRKLALLERIEKVMGKAILRDTVESETLESIDDEEGEDFAS